MCVQREGKYGSELQFLFQVCLGAVLTELDCKNKCKQKICICIVVKQATVRLYAATGNMGGRDSSVGIVTRYGPDVPGI
jgi:hypothetical protein